MSSYRTLAQRMVDDVHAQEDGKILEAIDRIIAELPPPPSIIDVLEANPLKEAPLPEGFIIEFKCSSCGSNPDVDCICKGQG